MLSIQHPSDSSVFLTARCVLLKENSEDFGCVCCLFQLDELIDAEEVEHAGEARAEAGAVKWSPQSTGQLAEAGAGHLGAWISDQASPPALC